MAMPHSRIAGTSIPAINKSGKIKFRRERYITMKATCSCLSVWLITMTAVIRAGAQVVSMPDVQSVLISDAGPGLEHWRVERSSNLTDWVAVDAMETLGGTGVVDMSWALLEPVAGYSYRVVSDSSVSNVLSLPATPYPYSSPNLPAHLLDPAVQASINTPLNNPVTDAGATLGRVLFYDKKLSANHSISCSSCHIQANGFSDPAVFSTGFDGGLTDRNSMGLSSARFYQRGRFFWDERAATLEIQTLQPVQHAVEMGMTLTGLVSRMQGYEYYPVLFTAAFGDPAITTNRIARALAQFVRSMDSYQSAFDAGVAVGFTNFTPLELQGQQLFNGLRGNCVACHAGPNFVGVRIDNNGLEFPFVDLGVGGDTGNTNDMGKFKMSSLRNIEKTAPYMHDGRFATLEQVVDHYSTGVVQNVNLGGPLQQPGAPGQPPVVRRPNFTAQERAALVAFMKTLTDPVFLADPKFSDPF